MKLYFPGVFPLGQTFHESSSESTQTYMQLSWTDIAIIMRYFTHVSLQFQGV